MRRISLLLLEGEGDETGTGGGAGDEGGESTGKIVTSIKMQKDEWTKEGALKRRDGWIRSTRIAEAEIL